MKFNITTTEPKQQKSDCLILPIYEEKNLPEFAKQLDKNTQKALEDIIKTGDIVGKLEQTLLLHQIPGIQAKRLLLIGCGKAPLSDQKFQKIVTKSIQTVKSTNCVDSCVYLADIEVKNRDMDWKVRQITEMFASSTHASDQLKSKPARPSPLNKISIHVSNSKQQKSAKQALNHGQAISLGMQAAKNVANLPGNVCTPAYLAKEARKLARKHPKISTKVIEEKTMRELGMGALLAVSAGSAQPAKLIIMNYSGGKKTDKPYVLVGKGITFDTGGISLKPGLDMDEMKFDMCGAASVLGTMTAIAELELPLNVIGVITSAENMPGGKATKPGDIVTTMSGQTVEILNTDAEGRLVLCDALTYVERFKPQAVIDIATLTGACVIALGHHPSGMFSNDDDLAEDLIKASQFSSDRVWQLPLWDDYHEQLDSNFADMANIGGRAGGTITAACYLSRFTQKYPWAHLDIAGTAWFSGKNKGASGRPVPLLTQYLIDRT